jgi:hypothetical protein
VTGSIQINPVSCRTVHEWPLDATIQVVNTGVFFCTKSPVETQFHHQGYKVSLRFADGRVAHRITPEEPCLDEEVADAHVHSPGFMLEAKMVVGQRIYPLFLFPSSTRLETPVSSDVMRCESYRAGGGDGWYRSDHRGDWVSSVVIDRGQQCSTAEPRPVILLVESYSLFELSWRFANLYFPEEPNQSPRKVNVMEITWDV